MATTTVSGDVQTGATFQYTNRVVLPADVTATASYTDITDLQFYAKAGNVYRFKITVFSTVTDVSTDGHAISVNGPASPTFLAYRGLQPTGATTIVNTNGAAYNLPAAKTATTASTAGNINTVEGVIQPATSGNVVARVIGNTSVVLKGYLSSLEWVRIG